MKGRNYPYIALVQQFLTSRAFFVGSITVVGFLIFAIPSTAYANPFEDALKNAAAAVVSVAIAGTLWVLNWLSVGLLILAVATLKTVMSFVLQAAYTPLGAGEGSSITVAWTVVRDFSNMLFILILMAIGVGTMLMNFKLPIPGQQTIGPGLLVKFLLVAALINFTPVLTGLIIDVSNILTKFFFDVAAGGTNAFITFNPFTNSADDWKPVFNLNVAAGLAIQYGVAFIFNLVASLILFTVSALLVVRVLALWLLVILSPLAFAASILPQSQKIFKDWWGHFLQWVILPVPIGLFLWIAALILAGGGQACTFTGVGTEISSDYDVPVNNVLQGRDGRAFCGAVTSTMALGAVIAGMAAAFSVSAKGSGFIVSRAQNIQKAAPKWAGRTARRGAVIGATQGIPAVGRGVGRSAGWLARRSPKPIKNAAAAGAIAYGPPIQQKLSAVGRGAQKAANLPGVKQAGNIAAKLGKGAVAPMVGAVDNAITKEKEIWKGIKKYDGIKGNFAALRRQANLELLSDNRAKLVDLMATEHPDDFAKMDKSEVLRLLKSVAFQSGAAKNALNIHPDLAGQLAAVAGKNPAVELKKQTSKVTDKTLETIAPSSWANEAFVKEILEQNKLTIKTYEKIGSKNLDAIKNLESSLERIRETVAKDPSGRIDEKKWGEYLSQNTDMAREIREYTNNSPTLRILAGTDQVEVRDKSGNVVRDRNRQPVTKKVGVLHQKPNNSAGGEEGSGSATTPPPPTQ